MYRGVPVLLVLSLVASGPAALPGQPPAAPPADARATILHAEQENVRHYRKFTTELLTVAQRCEKGDDPQTRELARKLRAALELADREGVELLFVKLVKLLQLETPGGADFNDLLATSNRIDKALLEMFTRLGGDTKGVALRRDVNEARGVIKEIEEVKKAQEVIAAKTEVAKTPPEALAADQQKLADRTRLLGAGFIRRDEKDQPVPGPSDHARQKLEEAVTAQNAAAPLLKQAKWEAAHKHETAAIQAIDAALQDVQARARPLIEEWTRRRAVELDAQVWDLFGRERTVRELVRDIVAGENKKRNPEDLNFQRKLAADFQSFYVEHLKEAVVAFQAEQDLGEYVRRLVDTGLDAEVLLRKLRSGDTGAETQRLVSETIATLTKVREGLQTRIAPHRVGPNAEGAPEHTGRDRNRLTEAALLRSLESLIHRRDDQRAAILRWERARAIKPISDAPSIKPVGPQFLAKGEAKKLKHGINWNLYPKDELAVTLMVYAAADKERKTPLPADVLGHSANLKLTFDDHPTDFEYDLKAGTKEGEYVLVLTPEAGEPVVVPVTIK